MSPAGSRTSSRRSSRPPATGLPRRSHHRSGWSSATRPLLRVSGAAPTAERARPPPRAVRTCRPRPRPRAKLCSDPKELFHVSRFQRTSLRRRVALAAALVLSGSLALAACGGGGDGSGGQPAAAKTVSQADIDKAMSTPTELTFWTWVPNIQKEVDLFQKKYPAIKVKVVNAGQGTPQYTKLRTALKAGTGFPDAVQIEFQYIPTFSITKSLMDLRPYGGEALKDKFVPWTWQQVVGSDGQVWAIPQDSGPMGMLYRKDIF